MAATASHREIYDKLLQAAVAAPLDANFRALRGIIVEMRAMDTPCGRVVVRLRPEWPEGQAFEKAYTAAQQEYPELPPIEWCARKDPKGRSAQQKYRAARLEKFMAAKKAKDKAPKMRKVRPLDEASGMALAQLQAEAGKAGTGNPFADKLAALRG